MHNAEVSVIADSISTNVPRITTFQLRYWRPIHSELMTHRKFSRSAGSSRARPSKAIIEQVMNDPWGPLHWGKNQPGMQANTELDHSNKSTAVDIWRYSAQQAAKEAQRLLDLGAHKQIVNRILEPYTYIDVVVTATEYNNWFALRDHADAQPEIADLAQRMKAAMDASEPKFLKPGEWHLPYITEDDFQQADLYIRVQQGLSANEHVSSSEIIELVRNISAARCARVSYKAFDGTVASIKDDLDLCDKLMKAELVHASPFEHQARPDYNEIIEIYRNASSSSELLFSGLDYAEPHLHGNFTGWCQHRKLITNEYIPG